MDEDKDNQGNLKRVRIESYKYVESDAAVVNRVIGKEIGGKQNILVFNDEAHHAYRIRQPENGDDEDDDDDTKNSSKKRRYGSMGWTGFTSYAG